MPEISDKILTLTEFKHQSIIQEFRFLQSKNYTLNVIMCMVSWKHGITPESAYQIYKKSNSELNPETSL
jgi:hypothetical protein